jgi:hypothetical protein
MQELGELVCYGLNPAVSCALFQRLLAAKTPRKSFSVFEGF